MRIEVNGTLESYFETGMEGIGLQLHRDEFETKNPNYDPNDSNKGPEFYHSWDGVVSLNKQDKIKIIDSPLSKYNSQIFTLGDLKKAAKDKYRFGACYPFEDIPLQDWFDLFACGKTKAIVELSVKTIAFYGGTFDPIHNGHKQIIDTLRYKYDLVLVLPSNNWTKENQPIYSIDERITAVKAVCDKFYNVKVLDWSKHRDTAYTANVVDMIKDEFNVIPHIVIGEDNIVNIEKWKKWDYLKQLQFVVFARKTNGVVDLKKFDKSPIFWKHDMEVSSTQIKKEKCLDMIPEEAKKVLDLSRIVSK